MPGSDWLIAIETVRGALETDTKGTVFEQPGKVAQLPDALGGDPKRWPALGAVANAAVSKNAFFELVQAKAQFLMLPKPIVKIVKDSSKVKIDEKLGIAKAYTSQIEDPREAFMHVPTAGADVAKTGYDLGRTPTVMASDNDILGTIYHEMTHAWLWLAQFYDAEIQKLAADGEAAYKSARGENGTEFKPWTAFTEAAGYYVGDRVHRWCSALKKLDVLMRRPPPYPGQLETQLQKIVKDYDEFVPAYGWVPVSETREEKIKEPSLSIALRDVIDKKILDRRPLTKPFAETPLAGLRAALLGP
jgi:hypothetical protein